MPSTPAMQKVAQHLRLELGKRAICRRRVRTAPSSARAASARRRWRRNFPPGGSPMRLSHQIVLLHSLASGHLDHLADDLPGRSRRPPSTSGTAVPLLSLCSCTSRRSRRCFGPSTDGCARRGRRACAARFSGGGAASCGRPSILCRLERAPPRVRRPATPVSTSRETGLSARYARWRHHAASPWPR